VSAGLAGCGSFEVNLPDRSALAGTADWSAYEAAKRDAWIAWVGRHKDPENEGLFDTAIANWEKAWAIDPSDRFVLQNLAVAHYYKGLYFTPEQEEATAVYAKGWEYGKLAVLTNPAIKAEYDKDPEQIHKAIVAHMQVGDVPGAYWMSVNWAKTVEHGSVAKRAISAPKVKAIMERIHTLGESYFGYAVHRFFGAYYVKAPGQGAEGAVKSRESFESAIAQFPGNMETKVLMGQYYCVHVDDSDLFEKLMNEVISAPDDFGPSQFRFDNYHAKKRAQHMLDTMWDGDLF
jgi:tetratricopeptide (TPR) repeat protein